jgi:hypothetical protein
VKEISIYEKLKSKGFSWSCIAKSLGNGSFSNENAYIILQHIDYSYEGYKIVKNIPGKQSDE